MDLTHTELFRGIAATDATAILALAVPKSLMAGERLYSTDQPPAAVMLIEHGSIDIIPEGRETRVITLASGQLIGQAAFFDRGGQHYTATARESTRLLSLSFDALDKLLEERPQLALVVYKNAARSFAHVMRTMALELEHPYF